MASSGVLNRVDRRVCPHCDKSVSYKTYKAHKRLYYDAFEDSWTRTTAESRTSNIGESESPPRMIASTVVDPVEPEDINMDDLQPPSTEYDDNTSESENGEELWDEREEDILEDINPPSLEVENNIGDQNASIFVRWIITFIFHLKSKYSLSDAVANEILKFMSILFGLLGTFSSICLSISKGIPSSLYKMQQFVKISKLQFHRYVTCRKCFHIYKFEDCVGYNQSSKSCPHKEFPNHRYVRMRQPCNTPLLKTVELASGKKILYPYLVYCYLGIERSLQPLLLMSEFNVQCEKWRKRSIQPNVLRDVYDGKVWEEFQSFNGKPFLSSPLAFGLTLNLDWFRPFKHTKYSVGAIYITIMNLPRNLRYKPEYVSLIGILPGPSEPSNINFFLEPLVKELNEFWEGKELHVCEQTSKKKVRCALLCAACDLPAGRKLCGFLSYTAHQGCSRCHKIFTGGAGDLDYSGFDRCNWAKRNRSEHIAEVRKISQCNTITGREQIESNTGYRYTELLDLPYFDPSRMLVVDPMHNLFLGSGKRVVKEIWTDCNVISEGQFELIQSRIDRMVTPPDMGRIPHKIMSGFSSFTADQYKNWIIHFSLISLRDILSTEHLECWRHFVLACRIMCSNDITRGNIQLVDALLMAFCKRVERLYGRTSITPNMHMHVHLSECISDYGPCHSFWLFPFERYNGILENQPNNNRSVETQLMKRFVCDNAFLETPKDYNNNFASLFTPKRVVGTLSDNYGGPIPSVDILVTSPLNWSLETIKLYLDLPNHCRRSVFMETEMEELRHMYANLFDVPSTEIALPASHLRYNQISINGKTVGAHKCRSTTSSVVMVVNPIRTHVAEERPARINYFAQHSVLIQSESYKFLLINVSYFKPHRDKLKFGKPVTMWEPDIFEISSTLNSLLPVQCIKRRTVSLVDKVCDETVLLISPCINF